jgi:subtilisin family serine protease/PKD repeat protein
MVKNFWATDNKLLNGIKTGALAFIFIFVAVLPLTIAQAKINSRGNPQKKAPDQLIIKFKNGIEPDQNFLKTYGLKSANKILKNHKFSNQLQNNIKKTGLDRLYVAQAQHNSSVDSIIKDLDQDSQVEYAEPNYIIENNLILPNDSGFSNLWGMHNAGQTAGTPDADIDMPETWDITQSSNITVGIIDTGIDYNHPDLTENVWANPGEIPGNGIDDDSNGFIDDIHGWDFFNNDNDPLDDNGHGTHVAGTIAAVGNNEIGVAGINWHGKVAALKFLNNAGSGTTDGAIQALAYANMMGFKITNNSWGGGNYSQALYDAIATTNADGNLFVAAAGNNGENGDLFAHYPAGYDLPNIISVAATDHNDALPNFSNYGQTSVDLGAPGVNIYSTVPQGTCAHCDPSGYKSLNGTSMATPHVSGAAALLWSALPSLTVSELKNKIIDLSESVPTLQGKTVSGGRLNVYNFFEPDTTAPAAITGLSISNTTEEAVTLTWTAIGDDGMLGKANRYDIRYSQNPIDETNFSSATPIINNPQPAMAGTAETVILDNLNPQTTYFFAIKAMDNAGNLSPLSNLQSATTLAGVTIFSEDVEDSVNGWSVDGNDGLTGATLWHQDGFRRSFSPTKSFYYGKWTGGYDTGARNWGSLVSPQINLTNIINPKITFQQFLETENSPNYDKASVDISTNGSANWQRLTTYYSTNDVWTKEKVDISSFAGATIKIRFFFDTIDADSNNHEGWYVDDIKIQGSPADPNNTAPVANIGGPYSPAEDAVFTLDGSGSSDAQGDTLTYTWNFGDGNTATTAQPTTDYTYTRGGTYTVTLMVNDGLFDSAPSSVVVNVPETNDAPVAQFMLPGFNLFANQSYTFDASGSSDEEGDSLTYSWDFDGDNNIDLTTTNPITDHIFTQAGPNTIKLTVNDGLLHSTMARDVQVTTRPTANPGGPYNGNEAELINFDGSASTIEGGGTIDNYTWDFGDGTGDFTFTPLASHTYTQVGTYILTLTASSNGVSSQPATTTVNVINHINRAPIAHLNGPYTATEDQVKTFSAIGSLDEEGSPLTYQWNFGDGTSTTTPTSTVSHIYLQGGNKLLTLIVNDGTVNSNPVTTTVSVTEVNDRPVAKVGGPYSPIEDEAYIFNGSGSTDEESSQLVYTWTIAGVLLPPTTSPTISYTFTRAGIYSVKLIVSDGLLNSLTDTAIIGVTEKNDKPVANINGPYTATEDQAKTFSGAGSTDEEGSALTYKWNFGDGVTTTTATSTVNHTYLQGGNYTLTLIVNDGLLDSVLASTNVSVTAVNDKPVANAGADQIGNVQDTLTFNGSGSSDEEGALASYSWNFGDNSTANGVNSTHTFNAVGTFTVTLTVTDSGGLTATDTLSVTVNPGDVITITKATWKKSNKQLTVEATSSAGSTPTLTVVGFGTMSYISSLGKYQLIKNSVSTQPATVIVNSSLGGSATKATTQI